MAFKERVFSGVQPTGNLHLGNYLGAIVKFVALQEKYDCIYCVVDMHAITVWQDPAELKRSIREVTAAFIASGIDPKKHIVFNQSQVAEHAELAWIFNCVARLGWLNRMTQFKEKAGKDRENASVGLYAYPNLMAADILVYRATHVPVGEDQKQHLELARDIAQKFNNDFAASIAELGLGPAFFPQPEPLIQGPATRVMSLRDGTKKMSKSDPSDYSRINLTDDADAIAQKVRKAKTDPNPLPHDEKGLESRPEADNLVGIFAALANRTKAEVLNEFGGAQFSNFKAALVDLSVAKLGPIGAEMKRLVQDTAHIDAVLVDGAARAQAIAAETMRHVKDIVGFVRSRNRRPKSSNKIPDYLATDVRTASMKQIHAAIDHFDWGEFECAITLAGAAEGILQATDEPHFRQKVKELSASPEIRAEGGATGPNDYINWLKHGQVERDGPRIENAQIPNHEAIAVIWRSITKFRAVYGDLTSEMMDFAQRARTLLQNS